MSFQPSNLDISNIVFSDAGIDPDTGLEQYAGTHDWSNPEDKVSIQFLRKELEWDSKGDLIKGFSAEYEGPVAQLESEYFFAESICGEQDGKFLVHWKGYTEKERTWEPPSSFTDADYLQQLIQDFRARSAPKQPSPGFFSSLLSLVF